MLRLAFDFIITWRETRTRPNAYKDNRYSCTRCTSHPVRDIHLTQHKMCISYMKNNNVSIGKV